MDYAIEKNSDIRHIIHCGDVSADIEYLDHVYGATHSICGVCGNNDYISHEPYNRIITVKNKRIYVTHGHREHVKSSLYTLKSNALSNNCEICIYGHTHTQFTEQKNDLIVLNPGSIGYVSYEYAIIDVKNDGVDIKLMKL